MGAFGYADDVILLAPTRHSLQVMLDICQDFADSHNMLFSTDPKPSKSKTKCLYYTTKTIRILPEPVILNKNPLPWVDVANHLGNELSVNMNHTLCCLETKHDLLVKRAIFFSRAHSLKQEFGFALPKIICELLRIYGTSFYGSVLWNLNCAEYGKLIRPGTLQ